MTKIYCILITIALMVPLILLAPVMAVSPGSSVLTHFIYMFAHANILHLFINAWGILLLHNLYTGYRMIAAYISAVILSFLYYPDRPVLGASVFIAFFTGFMILWLFYKRRTGFYQVIALLTVGCLIPHVASAYHIIMFAVGLLYNRIEWLIADYNIITKQ